MTTNTNNSILHNIFSKVPNINDYCMTYITGDCNDVKCEKVHSYLLKYKYLN